MGIYKRQFLLTHELVILTKFHNDLVKIVDHSQELEFKFEIEISAIFLFLYFVHQYQFCYKISQF